MKTAFLFPFGVSLCSLFATVDKSGVALAVIQGLNQKLEECEVLLREELKRRDAENTELKQQLNQIQATLNELTKTKGYKP